MNVQFICRLNTKYVMRVTNERQRDVDVKLRCESKGYFPCKYSCVQRYAGIWIKTFLYVLSILPKHLVVSAIKLDANLRID